MTILSLAFTVTNVFFPDCRAKYTSPSEVKKKKTKQTKTMEKRHFSLTAKYINQGYYSVFTQGVSY